MGRLLLLSSGGGFGFSLEGFDIFMDCPFGFCKSLAFRLYHFFVLGFERINYGLVDGR